MPASTWHILAVLQQNVWRARQCLTAECLTGQTVSYSRMSGPDSVLQQDVLTGQRVSYSRMTGQTVSYSRMSGPDSVLQQDVLTGQRLSYSRMTGQTVSYSRMSWRDRECLTAEWRARQCLTAECLTGQTVSYSRMSDGTDSVLQHNVWRARQCVRYPIHGSKAGQRPGDCGGRTRGPPRSIERPWKHWGTASRVDLSLGTHHHAESAFVSRQTRVSYSHDVIVTPWLAQSLPLWRKAVEIEMFNGDLV
jgi:hypothetical protein